MMMNDDETRLRELRCLDNVFIRHCDQHSIVILFNRFIEKHMNLHYDNS